MNHTYYVEQILSDIISYVKEHAVIHILTNPFPAFHDTDTYECHWKSSAQ